MEKDRGDDMLHSKSWGKEDDSHQSEASLRRDLTVEPRNEIVSRVRSGDNVDGVLNSRSHKEDNRRRRESGSPPRSDEKKIYYDGGNMEVERKNKTLMHSPSHDSYRDELRYRSRSRSYDHARERSRSCSVIDEDALSKRRQKHADKSKLAYDSNGDGTAWGHDAVDAERDDERDLSTGYSSRYVGVDDRHRSRERRTRERSREREVERHRKREKERARSRDREIDRDRRREKERERSREWDLDRDKRRERVRDRSRDREVESDRKREKERDRSRDRSKTVDRSRDSERERERDRDRYSDRVERKQERRDDGNRDRGRDRERDKYESLEDIHRERDRYRHSRSSRHDEKDYINDRIEKIDPAIIKSSKADSSVVGDGISKRYLFILKRMFWQAE